jgi:hypothetical protein
MMLGDQSMDIDTLSRVCPFPEHAVRVPVTGPLLVKCLVVLTLQRPAVTS